MNDPRLLGNDEGVEVRVARLEERLAAIGAATKLQAAEYERRLKALNHAHEQAIEVQHTYVTAEKYEDKLHAEAMAREIALDRINEKFDDYVKRYEQRQREVDLLLQAQAQSTATAERAAEKLAQAAKDAADEQGRKNNRNIGIASVALTAVIVTMNLIGAI